MLYYDADSAPHFLKHSFKFKELKDMVNTKVFTNPKANVKNIVSTFKKNPLEGAQMLGEPLLGGGARYSAVNDFVLSKGKVKYDANREYSGNMLKPGYDLTDLDPKVPSTPVADAPVSRASGSVRDSMRSSKLAAAKRKGFLGTLFAKETGGYGSNKTFGGAGGSSILGA